LSCGDPKELGAGKTAGEVTLWVSCFVTHLLEGPAAASFEEHPSLRAFERSLTEALGELAVRFSVKYMEPPW
jgi:hypothetical protein